MDEVSAVQSRKNKIDCPLTAITAIVTFCGTLALFGCVVPVDIHERTDALGSPWLDRTLVSPSPDRVVELTETVTEFSVAAALKGGAELTDDLYFQWYVGYPESTVPLPPAYESFKTIQFNACGFKDILEPTGSTHTIELFISSEPVEFDASEGRILPSDFMYVSWQVRFKVDCP